MRSIAITCLGLLAASCSMTTKDGSPIVLDGSITGTITELANPGSTYKNREAADKLRCQKLGFKPGTEAFANCRLQIQAARSAEDRAVERRKAEEDSASVATPDGKVVYDRRECAGPVLMGECHGSIIPDAAHHPTCHGELVNGQCTGPMF